MKYESQQDESFIRFFILTLFFQTEYGRREFFYIISYLYSRIGSTRYLVKKHLRVPLDRAQGHYLIPMYVIYYIYIVCVHARGNLNIDTASGRTLVSCVGEKK